MTRAYIHSGKQRVAIEDIPVTIGRAGGNTICLNSDRVSGRHCVIRWSPSGNGIEVRDLGSTNGTKVNGELISSRVLRSGDMIEIDRWAFHVEVLREPIPDRSGGVSVSPQPIPNVPRRADPRSREKLAVGLALAGALLLAVAAVAVLPIDWQELARSAGVRQKADRPAKPIEDPTPPPEQQASQILSASPRLAEEIEAHGREARTAVELLGELDRLAPVLTEVDRWRRHRPELLSGLSLLTGGCVPDNTYDAVVAVLDLKAPGTGEALLAIEGLLRKGLAVRSSLGRLHSSSAELSAGIRSFQASPNRSSLSRLAEQIDRYERSHSSTARELVEVQHTVGKVLGGIETVGRALNSAQQSNFAWQYRSEFATLKNALRELEHPVSGINQRISSLANPPGDRVATLTRLSEVTKSAR